MRGYFGIGVYHPKNSVNIGTLWRSASLFGASFIFTIGRGYKKQHSDTLKTWRHIPLFEFETIDDLRVYDSPIIAAESCGENLITFDHPERCIYLLGAEDNGLPESVIKKCRTIITVPSVVEQSFNVTIAGSIIMYDRIAKQ